MVLPNCAASAGSGSSDRDSILEEAPLEYITPNIGVSSFLILSPLVFKFVSYNNLLKTNEFLDFTLKVRSQKCLLEKLIIDNGDSLPSQDKKGKK